jgi:3-deoxy-D-manno-octulosonic-acid transferase
VILALYRVLTTLAEPAITAYLRHRMAHGKEDQARFGERQGVAVQPRPAGRLVWLHAASVGEAVSVLPVLERIQAQPGTTALITTGTVASAALLALRLPKDAIHQYVPVDRVPWVRRFLDHWRPDLALWLESEFWPNLLVETAARGVPIVLLNGRISPRSFERWRRYPALARRILSCFQLCLGQTEADAERLRQLGARHVAAAGNLKFAAPPLPADPDELAHLTHTFDGRPRWLAASTHAGEEAIAATVHRELRTRFPGLLTIIAPRHPNRGRVIAAELSAMGLSVARRSAGDAVTGATDILLADTIGELGLLIRLAPLVFMGKSLTARGGQNPLEPARLGASVLFGPLMDNFDQVAARMEAAQAAHLVQDERSLADAIARRLADPAMAGEEGRRASLFANAEASVLDAVLRQIEPWLEGVSAPGEAVAAS